LNKTYNIQRKKRKRLKIKLKEKKKLKSTMRNSFVLVWFFFIKHHVFITIEIERSNLRDEKKRNFNDVTTEQTEESTIAHT
jgi:hypothetical protein